MPHLICRTCRVRYRRPGDAPLETPVGFDGCPSCGLPLEPVTDLSQLVGFRAEDGSSERHGAPARDTGAWGTLKQTPGRGGR